MSRQKIKNQIYLPKYASLICIGRVDIASSMVSLLFQTSLMAPLRPGLRSSTRRHPSHPFNSLTFHSDGENFNSPLTASSDTSSDNNSDPDFRLITHPARTPVDRRVSIQRQPRQHVYQQHSPSRASRRKRRRIKERNDGRGDSNVCTEEAEQHALSPKQVPNQIHLQDVRHTHSVKVFSDIELSRLRTQLLDWYSVHHRSFPWRAPPRHIPNSAPLPVPILAKPSSPGAPYAVWISEVMSQQTRIDVVVSYYKKWMQQLPTIDHLANVSLEVVYELWAGLGYYRRAKFLHEGAKQIVEKHGGKLPEDLRTLYSIKGIGKYTAGAIASIAFQQPVACVDGNVDRVLSRLRPGIGSEANTLSRMKSVWKLAESCVVEVQVPGDFNQALMELGATVCKPRLPDCSRCPVSSLCGAYAEATVSEIENVAEFVVRYPAKAAVPRCKVRPEAVVALVVWRKAADGSVRIMLMKRKTSGLLEGLWEAPNQVVGPSFEDGNVTSCVQDVQDKIRQVLQANSRDDSREAEIYTEEPLLVGEVTHIFSHIRQTLRVMSTQVVVKGGTMVDVRRTNQDDQFRWLSLNEIELGAISTQMKKVLSKAFASIQSNMSSNKQKMK